MRRWVITIAISVVACGGSKGQRLETNFVVTGAGVRPLQRDVVRMSAKDQGTLFGGYQASFQIQLTGPATKWFTWRADMGYVFEHHRFELPCMCVMPSDRVVVIENLLTINGATLSVGGELRTPSEHYWFTSLQIGIEAMILARRNAEYAIRFVGQRPDTTETLVSDERYMPGSGWGPFVPQFQLSVGRQFWKWHPVRLELSMLQDLSGLTYGIENLKGKSELVQFRRTVIGVRLGVRLGRGAAAK